MKDSGIIDVLATPVCGTLTDRRYGKSYNLLTNLAAEDVRIDAFVGSIDKSVEPSNVHVHSYESANKIRYYSRAFKDLARHLRSGSYDVYHHMNLSYRWFNPALLAGIEGDTPVVIGPSQTGHQVLEEEFKLVLDMAFGVDTPRWISDTVYATTKPIKEHVIDRIRMQTFVQTLRHADKIVCVHQDAKDVYSNFVDPSVIDVIPLGVDPTQFKFMERKRSMDFVTIGALKRRKGYEDLLEAIPTVLADFPDARFHVFGNGPLETELKDMADQLDVADSVTFHGHVDQSVLRAHLHRARAFIHPSRSESFSLVRLEAMATGCPVIVSDTSGATEMVRDRCGFVVPIEAPEEIAQAATSLLSDFDLARRMGQRARIRVEEIYDWRVIGQQYLDVYRALS